MKGEPNKDSGLTNAPERKKEEEEDDNSQSEIKDMGEGGFDICFD